MVGGATPVITTAMTTEAQKMIAIVDPMSTGATLAFEAVRLGLKVCCVWSDVCPEEVNDRCSQIHGLT